MFTLFSGRFGFKNKISTKGQLYYPIQLIESKILNKTKTILLTDLHFLYA